MKTVQCPQCLQINAGPSREADPIQIGQRVHLFSVDPDLGAAQAMARARKFGEVVRSTVKVKQMDRLQR
jgi:hypothetical protein